jgi:hypothetical protein
LDFALSEQQRIFREQFRRFCEKEISPLVEDAEETETFPLELFPKMASLGYLCPRYPPTYGGPGIDKITEVVMREELSRVSQGIATSWSAHSHLGTYPIFKWGSEQQKQAFLIPAIRGEKIAAFALTEPDHGQKVGRRLCDQWTKDLHHQREHLRFPYLGGLHEPLPGVSGHQHVHRGERDTRVHGDQETEKGGGSFLRDRGTLIRGVPNPR